MPQIGYSHRQPPMGRAAMVASCHPLASLAGVETLKAGGNVVDAAVAVNGVLGVTQPCYCGIGGDFFCLYHEAATRRVYFLNGAGRSGSLATLEALGHRGLARVPETGPGSVSVPGVTRAWDMLLGRFGSKPLKELLAPAIQFAEDGFPVSDLVCQAIRERSAKITDPEWKRVFLPGGRPPRPGDCFRQPDLARTLCEVASDPDFLYGGRGGAAVVARLEGEGFLTLSDLAAHRGEWAEPIATQYRGYTVYETPPPSQGVAVLLALNMLETFDVAALPLHSAEHLHLLLEITKLAYADRDRWIGAPSAMHVPAEALLDKKYARRRRTEFDPARAGRHGFGSPTGDTTAFVVADGQGNMISAIQSLYGIFGSGVVPPGTGVVLHNRGAGFTVDPGHPNCFGPRKWPFHTLITCLVTDRDRPVIAYATSGGGGQAMYHVQCLTNLIDYSLDIQESIERTRFLCGPAQPDDSPETVQIEARIAEDVAGELVRRGHQVRLTPGPFAHFGQAHGVTLDRGTLTGGADPRGDGAALGF